MKQLLLQENMEEIILPSSRGWLLINNFRTFDEYLHRKKQIGNSEIEYNNYLNAV